MVGYRPVTEGYSVRKSLIPSSRIRQRGEGGLQHPSPAVNNFFVTAAHARRRRILTLVLPPSKPLRAVVAALLLHVSTAALAQSSPEPVSAAVVAVGVIALEPGADPSISAMSQHPASINGSGFFVSRKGHVITALHVLRAAEHARDEMQGTDNRLFVGLRKDSSFVAVPADVVGTDEEHDLALLRIKTSAPIRNVVKLSSARPEDGTLLEAAGLPWLTGGALVENIGHLAENVLLQPGNFIAKAPAATDTARPTKLREFYLADLKSDEGMSGGPVYLVDTGAVIGVVHGYTTNDPRLAVLVPARYAIELLKNNNVDQEESASPKSQ